MRALAYVRISELTDATTAPERQRREAERWVQHHGGELVDVVEDLDVSGYHRGVDRVGLRSALERLEAGEADTLVVWRIDRLARSIVTFHQVLERVEAAKGRLVSISESLDFGTAAGRMVANVLASFAQFESETISGRVKAAQAHLHEAGKWRGGRRPFGWLPEPAQDGKGHVLALHPEEAPRLREAAQRVLQGESLTAIAGAMNQAGVRTAQGEQWTRLSVRQMLSRKGVYGHGGSEPLLTQEDWIEVQKALAQRGGAGRAAVGRKGLLEHVHCGVCGYRMSLTSKPGRNGHRWAMYRCLRPPVPGTRTCGLAVIAERLEEAVLEEVLGMVGHMPAFEPEGEVVDLAADERAELEAALSRLEEDRYVGGIFTGEDGSKRYRDLYARLTGKLEALPKPQVRQSAVTVPLGVTFQEAFDSVDEDTKRALLASMPFTVEVGPGKRGAWDPERVTVRWAG